MTDDDRAEVAALARDYLRELHEPRLSYKPAEAARLLGVDERTVRRLIAAGQLRAIRPSSRLTLIPRDALYELLGVTDPIAPEAVAQ